MWCQTDSAGFFGGSFDFLEIILRSIALEGEEEDVGDGKAEDEDENSSKSSTHGGGGEDALEEEEEGYFDAC